MTHLAFFLSRYCQSLDNLPIGARVGVCRTDNGTLHFFINGEHQGVAATNIPQGMYVRW